MAIDDFCFTRFGGFGKALLKMNNGIEDEMDAANMRVDPVAYLSQVFFATLLVSAVSGGLILLLTLNISPFILIADLLPMPILFPVILAIIPLGVLGFGLVYPGLKASSRVAGLRSEIPYAFMYISVMVSGGLDPYTALLRIKNVKLLPHLRDEIGRIQALALSNGIDPITAMEKAAKVVNLKEYKELLLGYASAVRTGGDVFHYLYQQTDGMFKKLATDIKAIGENLSLVMETHIIVAILGGLCFYMFFVISMSVGGNVGMGMSPESFFLFSFIVLPFLNGMFLFLADASQMNFPSKNTKTYMTFFACIPLGLVLMMITVLPFYLALPPPLMFMKTPIASMLTLMGLPVGTEPAIGLAITLSLTVLPAIIVDYMTVRSESSILSGVTAFLRDMVETRKTGLSPERCIKSLSDRSYGDFSKHLKMINLRLSWGESLSKIYEDFSHKVKSWLSLINIYLLVDAIEVGGGKEESLETLAEFAEATVSLENERKKLLRPLLFVPYIGAVLLTATVIMLLQFFTNQPGTTMTMSLAELDRILLTPLVLHSFMIGLVAGKVSSGRVSSGFKHGIFLIIASLIGMRMAGIMPSLFSAPP
jgi:flagellar protein FlaJ